MIQRIFSFRAVPFLIALAISLFSILSNAFAQTSENKELFSITDPVNRLIPQFLLPCIHAAEVQAELGLTPDQINSLETILSELDGRWWPSRNLEIDKQRTTIADLEAELLKQLSAVFPMTTVQRLQQLELQAQGPRLMLRPDVAAQIGLSTEQQDQFKAAAQATENRIVELAKARLIDPEKKVDDQVASTKTKEIQGGFALLSDVQKNALSSLLGKKLDFSKMDRIYPIAPDLINTNEWVGQPISSLRALKGKVVVIHFYAFQCINCRNNFKIYNEWVQHFKNQDVVVIGIQTPETAAESDPSLVREAAERDKLTFPVLIDLGSKNWNAWANTMWPTVYVIDKRGYIRMWWQGELNWQGATGDQTISELINKLLKE